MVRIEFDGVAIVCNRPLQIIVAVARKASIVVDIGIVGAEPDGLVEIFEGSPHVAGASPPNAAVAKNIPSFGSILMASS